MNEDKAEVLRMLLGEGYELDGCTETFKVVTADSFPLPGGTIKGRRRLRLPGTRHRVTVGARTVSFYKVVDRKAQEFTNYATRELHDICAHAVGLKEEKQ